MSTDGEAGPLYDFAFFSGGSFTPFLFSSTIRRISFPYFVGSVTLLQDAAVNEADMTAVSNTAFPFREVYVSNFYPNRSP